LLTIVTVRLSAPELWAIRMSPRRQGIDCCVVVAATPTKALLAVAVRLGIGTWTGLAMALPSLS
jgi:hypothetical protein